MQLDEDWAKDEGRCFNCGFLGKRDGVDSPCEEVTMERRMSGELFKHAGKPYVIPVCYARIWSLAKEVPAEIQISKEEQWAKLAESIKEILFKDRQCPTWTLYNEGFSPKEHMEWLHMQQLEEARKAHALELTKLQIAVSKSVEEISKDHLEVVKINERQTARFNKQTMWFNRILVLLALAALVLAIGALAYPTGATWLDWVPGQRSTQTQQSIPNTATSQPQPTS